jgi:tetratricopeptide (TPR) repeat protein
MELSASLLRQLENPSLSPNQRVELRCQIARELTEAGNYEPARTAMGELWQRVGERPKIEGLEQRTAAEVLLRAGVLTGWIGSCNQIAGAQETAKNLISESQAIFESVRHARKVAEAQTELSLCYWRTGAYDEARVVLKDVLSKLKSDSDLKAKAILRSAIVEWGDSRYKDALGILTEAAPSFDRLNNHVLKGSYHNQLAIILRSLFTAEQREDYLDRAFVEYAAASYHFEQAGHKRYFANVENNLGFIYFKAGRFAEAHEHLDRARKLMVGLKDRVNAARVDETRARVFLAQGRNTEAERVAKSAVSALEQGGHQSLFAEALITHGTALARLGHNDLARFTLQRAIEVAEQAGTINRAGEATLAMIEELGGHLTINETQPNPSEDMLTGELRRYERKLIKDALIKARGRITYAARLLGTTHQRLAYVIENRHEDLLKVRNPIKHRSKLGSKKRKKN